MKAAIKKTLKTMGYDLRKFGDGWYTPKEWDDVYRNNYSKDALDNKRFYNVGAANFYHWAWTNIDKITEAYASKQKAVAIDTDLMACEPLPIEDGKGEVVYTSHTIEHVTDEAVQNLFSESHRILKTGGLIRITCPNVDLPYRAWQSGDRDYFYWQHRCSAPQKMEESNYKIPLREASLEQLFLSTFACNASEVHTHGIANPISDQEIKDAFANNSFEDALDLCKSRCSMDIQSQYPNSHINWWNPDKVTKFLNNAGFKEVYVSSYGQSRSPVLRDTTAFDSTHPKMSLYVEAIKT